MGPVPVWNRVEIGVVVVAGIDGRLWCESKLEITRLAHRSQALEPTAQAVTAGVSDISSLIIRNAKPKHEGMKRTAVLLQK